MPTPSLQYTEVDYSPCETGRKVAKAARVSFAVAMSCVTAQGGNFERALEAARELKAEGRRA